MSTPPETQVRDDSVMKKAMIQRGLQVFFGTLLIGVVLFLAAGRLDWTMGWVYLGVNMVGLLINMIVMGTKNPEVIAARAKSMKEGTKKWDKVFAAVYGPMPFITVAVAGLDAGRYGWSTVPMWAQWLGIGLFIFAWLFSLWALVANKYFETSVRIQKERGHETVTSGPYAIVRHPGYIAFSLMYFATPVFLGSWWGLVPAGVIAVLFVLRTAREDQALLEELPDYPAYAQKVRYRLLPGVW